MSQRNGVPIAGARIDGKFELIECLGQGGMGAVWSARHVSLGHEVAIKFLQNAPASSEARIRFSREARIAARLGEASRHIARVLDHGLLHGITPYLVMERLRGETLAQRLERDGRLPLDVVARYAAQLGRALEAAHLAGVVHRDVKPANVFLSATAHDHEVIVKLMDFGIARVTNESSEARTTLAGMAIGTPSYMSPEQLLDREIDPRADLWGFAAVVYFMATGRGPFGQGGIQEVASRVLTTEPPPPSSIVRALPRAFDAFMRRALAKEPERRFPSARELVEALAKVAGVALDARDSNGRLHTPAAMTILPRLARPSERPSSARRRGVATFGAVAAITGAIVFARVGRRAPLGSEIASLAAVRVVEPPRATPAPTSSEDVVIVPSPPPTSVAAEVSAAPVRAPSAIATAREASRPAPVAGSASASIAASVAASAPGSASAPASAPAFDDAPAASASMAPVASASATAGGEPKLVAPDLVPAPDPDPATD